jgi:hypothetical protein
MWYATTGYHFSLLINVTAGKPGCSVDFWHTDGSVLNIQQCTVYHPYIYFSERCFKCILESPSNYLNYKLCKTLSVSGNGLQYCVRHFAVLGHSTGHFRQAGRSVYRLFFLEEYIQQLIIYIYIYNDKFTATPWIWQFLSGLLPRRPGFYSGPVGVVLVVDTVTLVQDFLLLLLLSAVFVMSVLHTHSFSLRTV